MLSPPGGCKWNNYCKTPKYILYLYGRALYTEPGPETSPTVTAQARKRCARRTTQRYYEKHTIYYCRLAGASDHGVQRFGRQTGQHAEWYGECEDDKTQNKYAATLTFGNDGTCTWVLRDEIGDLFSSTQYLYEYNSPNVTIYLSEPDAETGDLKAAFNGYVLDKDQATIGGRNVYTMWLYDTQHNPAAYFWQY